MRKWMLDQNVCKIKFIPDGNGEFTRKMGMLVDKSNLGFGYRSWRYAMVVDTVKLRSGLRKRDVVITATPIHMSKPNQKTFWSTYVEHKNSSDVWTVNIKQDGEDLILPLPQGMLEELDWQVGDVLQWIDNGNGTFSLRKQQYDSDSGVEGKL
jgi:hypothetical protein